MYSDSIQDLNKSVAEVNLKAKDHIQFIKRFQRNYDRKEQWVKLYRLNILYRNHETNNYAEASIRIIKDILLSRTKAYNTVALVDFIVNVGEEYFTLRLLNHAHDRHSATHRLYSKLCSKMKNTTISEVNKIDTFTYSIPSENDKEMRYTINIELGICSCKDGCVGSFCKHQAWVHEHLKIQLPNSPAVTIEERYGLGVLAMGDKCPEKKFFLGLKENVHNDLRKSTTNCLLQNSSNKLEQANTIGNIDSVEINTSSTQDIPITPETSEINNDEIQTASQEWSRLQNMIPSLPPSILQQLTKRLKNIKNNQQFIGFIHSVNKSAASLTRKKGKIHVQPTALSRRKDGITRGSKRIPAGRRPKEYTSQKNQKRPNNLGQNISKNVLNSKKH